MKRREDPFEALATKIRSMAAEQAAAVAGRHLRFRITRVAPLAATALEGGITIDATDEDVEVYRAVATATLAVGDVVDVMETDEGYAIMGLVD